MWAVINTTPYVNIQNALFLVVGGFSSIKGRKTDLVVVLYVVVQDADCDETLPPAFILQRSNTCYSLCVEQCTILSKVKTFTEAVLAFFICHYVFNLEYGKEYKMAFLFIQVFLAGISEKGMPAKLLSLGLKLDRASKWYVNADDLCLFLCTGAVDCCVSETITSLVLNV